MRKYWHVLVTGIQNTLVYRFNFLVRILFGFIPLLATIFVWRTIYHSKGAGAEIGGYTLASMISYYIMVTIVDSLTAVADDDWQMARDIKEGTISQFLLKPMDYLSYRLTLFFSGRLIFSAVALVPLGVFIWFFREYWVAPASLEHFLVFIVSVALAGLLQFFISYSMAMLAFWVLEVSTFIFIVYAFEYVAGGHLFPLDILPEGVAQVLRFTPFPYQLFFPVSVYLGQVPASDLLPGLAVQAGWVLLFYGFARLMWHRGIRRYTAFGG